MGIGVVSAGLIKYSKGKRLELIDLKFTDIPVLWQHNTIPDKFVTFKVK